jgi:GT2 family glycosyltransferase
MTRSVHVIVLNWNGERVIAPCLASLLRVSDPPLEIIVVDNASTDDSAAVVRRDFPGVELIVNESNLLFAAGNNVGVRRALERGARCILLLNNDTEVEPIFAARLLAALESDPRAGVAGPKILYYDDPKRIWYGGGGFYPIIGVPRHVDIRRLDGSVPDRRGETEWVSGCTMLIRREVIEEIGLLDPSYTIYCEDVDFCLRARRAGWRCLYEPESRVWHKVSSSSGGGMTPFKLENRIASTRRLFARFRSPWWRALLAPVHGVGVVALIAGLFLCGRRELARAAWRGAVRAAAGL